MAKYDLTGGLETSFTFSIDGKEFSFRKPTVREMRQLAKKYAEADKEADQEKQLELSDEATAEMYGFITPVEHAETIADVLSSQPVDVQIAFNEMIAKELGVQK